MTVAGLLTASARDRGMGGVPGDKENKREGTTRVTSDVYLTL